FLRTVLEELRIFGVHEAIDMHLASYLAAENESELFQTVLNRMERDHGKHAVQSVMSAIWASRFGLSETELIEITGLSRLALSEFLIALEFHLMQHGGLFTFFHNYLRQACETRYIASLPDKKEVHRHLASYFSEEPYDERRRSEEPWQWQQSEDIERFKQCITDIPMLDMLLDESRQQELIGYWVELQKHFDLAETYHDASLRFRNEIPDDAAFAALSGKLGNALVAASSYKEAEYDLCIALDLRKKLFGENDLITAESMSDLATLFYHTGKFNDAGALFDNASKIREEILGENDPLTARTLNDLATIFYSQGKLDNAEKYFRIVLDRYQTYYKNDHPEVASTLNNIGSVLLQKSIYKQAIEYYIDSLRMYERLYGLKSYTLILPTQNLATCYMKIQENERADELYLKALVMNKTIYGEVHFSTAHIYANMGVFYSRIGNPKKAIEMHTKGLEIKKKILGEDHWETINSYINLGTAYYRSGNKIAGESLVFKYLPVLKKLLGNNHQIYLMNESAWNELTST
ncbi:MAG: tetratricopeptide repeat protein, partial [Candidatus Kapaibacterium sp.]